MSGLMAHVFCPRPRNTGVRGSWEKLATACRQQ